LPSGVAPMITTGPIPVMISRSGKCPMPKLCKHCAVPRSTDRQKLLAARVGKH
jgi:hypothetical protein